MGMLLECLGSSAPSAMIQVALFLHAGFFQQQGERHTGPLAATGEAVRLLRSRIGGNARIAARAARRAVAVALHEMKAGDEGQALEFVHGKNQGTIDHAVDQQMMFLEGQCRAARNHEKS